MLVLVSRAPTPDMPYWHGRRAIAATDAVGWPTLWLLVIGSLPFGTGIVGLVASLLLLLVAARRLHRAVFRNQRYRFTTLRWGTALLMLLVIGSGLKLMS